MLKMTPESFCDEENFELEGGSVGQLLLKSFIYNSDVPPLPYRYR